MYFSSKIKEERQKHNMSQQQLGENLLLVDKLFQNGNVEKVTLVLTC